LIADIVVDTNVWVHANNANEQRQEHAIALAKALLEAATGLCIDDGFDLEPAKNRSTIGAEYLNNLRAGMLGYEVVVALAKAGRIKLISRNAPAATSQKINQLIRKPIDRAFLRVAFNSSSKILVSHDFEDFQAAKRAHIRQTLKIRIIEADVAIEKIE
jgi:hypothetical protein